MQTGFGALEQVMKESAAKGNFGGKLEYFNIKDGERIVVRFLTDDIITADFAERVRTADGKYQDFTILDPTNNLVTRYLPTPDSWDGKIKKKTVGVCVVREQQLISSSDPGARPQYIVVDKPIVRDDGLRARQFLLVKQAHQNFWDQLVGFFGIYGTICDRDYVITRQGERLNTQYRIGPLDPDPNDPLRDPRVVAETYGYGRPWNKDADDRFMWCPQTAKEWYEYYGSEDRIKHFLVGDPAKAAQAAAQQPAQQWPQPPGYAPPQPQQWATPQQYQAPPAPPQQPTYAPPPQPGPAQYSPMVASQGQNPWNPPSTDPTATGGLGEFHQATTHNPAPPPPGVPGAPAPDQVAPAPSDEESFAALRARMQGYGASQQTT